MSPSHAETLDPPASSGALVRPSNGPAFVSSGHLPRWGLAVLLVLLIGALGELGRLQPGQAVRFRYRRSKGEPFAASSSDWARFRSRPTACDGAPSRSRF